MALLRRIALFLLVNLAFVLVLTALLYAVEYFTGIHLSGSVSGGLGGLFVFALVVGFAGSFFSLAISRWIAKRTYDIRLLWENERFSLSSKEQLLYTTVSDLAHRNGITMPEVGIYESPEPNAFATGPSRNSSLLAVSTGLLDTLSPDEITGVIGHEMSHILSGDMVTMTLLQGVLNTFVIFLARVLAYAVETAFSRSSDDEGSMGGFAYYLLVMLFETVLGIFAMLILMAYSRAREYRADAGSARLVGRDSMIHALTHLQTLTQLSDPSDTRMTAFKISGGRSWLGLFSSHPDMDDRIARLRSIVGV